MRGPQSDRRRSRLAPGASPRGATTAGLAAAAFLLGTAGLVPADDPGWRPDPLLVAARAAAENNRLKQTRPLGCHDARRTFTELPAQGAVLIGFDIGVGKFLDIETVYALRPVY